MCTKLPVLHGSQPQLIQQQQACRLHASMLGDQGRPLW